MGTRAANWMCLTVCHSAGNTSNRSVKFNGSGTVAVRPNKKSLCAFGENAATVIALSATAVTQQYRRCSKGAGSRGGTGVESGCRTS